MRRLCSCKLPIALTMMATTLATTLATSLAAQNVDFAKAKPEILEQFRALLRLNTSPPGNEILAVEYLKKALEAEGIPVQTFAADPKRPNLVARLKGNGSKKPLLILAHTDVVGVQREKWPVDPFGAVMKDGYIWGRGAVDDRPQLTAMFLSMLWLKRTGAVLDRDVIFLAESAEEADTTGVGINFMVREHFGEIEAEYALSEFARTTIENGKVSVVGVATAEKLPARVRLVASGTSGHGSIPRPDNPLVHLGTALGKIGTWEPPMRLNDTTRAYFEKLAASSPPDQAKVYNGLFNAATAAASQAYLKEHEPLRYSMLRTTVVPTMLKAGVGSNVIPSEAEATLDIRALPGEDLDGFYGEMNRVIGDDAVKIVQIPRTRPASPASPLDGELYRVIEATAKRMYPDAKVLPTMEVGASDMAQLRAKGIASYGIGVAATETDQINYGPHSDVERVAETSLYSFVELVYRTVTGIAVHPPAGR